MKTRRMGRTGLKVSEICLGTMTFGHQCDEKTSFAIMDRAAERGVDFIDTADVYPVPPSVETAGRSEEIVGNWLKGQRNRFVLATKCRMRVGHGPNDEGLSRRHILQAVEDSLRRLGTDYIDLYQPHSPRPRYAARRNASRPRRPGPAGQGPLPRLLELSRLAAGPVARLQRPP